MYLLGFVNSTFEPRRPTGNLELVDLKYQPPEPAVERCKELHRDVTNSHLQYNSPQDFSMIRSCSNGNGTVTSTKIENGNVSNGSATATLKPKPIARPRRTSLEDLPADLYMEPLSPLLLRSPEGVGSRLQQNTKWVPEETSVHWLQEDLASRGQELDQEWSFCIGKQRKQTSNTKWRMTTTRWASTFESVFADGGISIRVQHHPLETTEEEEDQDTDSDASEDSRTRDTIAGDKIGGDANVESLSKTDEGYARMLQHLEGMEKDAMKARKLPSPKTEGDGAISSQELDAKLDIEQPGLQGSGVPIAAPSRSSKLGDGNAEPRDLAKLPSLSPSLSSPVMEKMDAAVSPEVPYSWNKKLPKKLSNKPKLGTMRESMRDERDLRYPTAKMTKSDAQEELSFHLWERGPISRDSQELDLENSQESVFDYANSKGGGDDSMEIVKIPRKLSPPNVDALLNLRTFDLRSKRSRATTPNCEEDESEQDYPSPSSFTCGLSPTSLFSDDQEPFRLSVSSSDDNMFLTFQKRGEGITASKSPRSVLFQEPDEIGHFPSDSSETGKNDKQRKQTSVFKYLYNDESSDLESPMKGIKSTVVMHQPFPAFTYSVSKLDMGGTSSDEDPHDGDPDEARDENVVHIAGSLQALGLFQDLNHREPWLVNDGGVLDDSEDLEFLLSADSKRKDTPLREETSPLREKASPVRKQLIQSPAKEEIPEIADLKTKKHESPRRRRKWVPYVTGELHGNESPPPAPQPSGGVSRPQGKASVAKFSKRNDTTSVPLGEETLPLREETSPLREQLILSPAKEEIPEIADSKTKKHESPRRRPKWVPYVTGELHGNESPPLAPKPSGGASRPQGKASVAKFSRGEDKAPKRSVNFAPDLVKEIPYSSTPIVDPKQPAAAPVPRANSNVKKEEELATPSKVKKPWEIEEEGPSIMTSRRRWRRNRDEDSKSPGGSTRWWRNQDEDNSKSPGGSTRSSWTFAETRSRSKERAAEVVMPCAGRLFSWPRRFGCKVSSSRSRSRRLDSDDDCERSFVGDQSFGMSSRRDAELVRRILKGSQKKYSNLTGADILKEDFG